MTFLIILDTSQAMFITSDLHSNYKDISILHDPNEVRIT